MSLPVRELLAVAKFLSSPEGKMIVKSAKGQMTGADKNSVGATSETNNSDLENMSQQQKLDKVREIMVGDPTDYLIRGAASAAKGVSDFIGNKAVTDANRLASAILSLNRTNSARQNDIYGPSKKEMAAEAWANEKQRRGQNVKNATDQITNVINDTAGLYAQRDDVARAMEAQMVTQAPGSFYNYANSLQRASQAGKGKRN